MCPIWHKISNLQGPWWAEDAIFPTLPNCGFHRDPHPTTDIPPKPPSPLDTRNPHKGGPRRARTCVDAHKGEWEIAAAVMVAVGERPWQAGTASMVMHKVRVEEESWWQTGGTPAIYLSLPTYAPTLRINPPSLLPSFLPCVAVCDDVVMMHGEMHEGSRLSLSLSFACSCSWCCYGTDTEAALSLASQRRRTSFRRPSIPAFRPSFLSLCADLSFFLFLSLSFLFLSLSLSLSRNLSPLLAVRCDAGFVTIPLRHSRWGTSPATYHSATSEFLSSHIATSHHALPRRLFSASQTATSDSVSPRRMMDDHQKCQLGLREST